MKDILKMLFGGDFQAGVYDNGGKVDTKLSVSEVGKIAKATANALGSEFSVTKGSVDNGTFDLDYKGEKYDGGSYLIMENGDVVNVALRGRPIYYNYKTKKKFEFGGDFQSGVYAMGGSLQAHGIKVGDTFIKTMSGAIQKVKDKSGNIVYVNLATGERSSQPLMPFNNGGAVTNERLHVNKGEDYEVRYAKPRPARKGYKGLRSFDSGGDLFEDYQNQPKELAKIVDSYMEKINDGDFDYVDSRKFLKEVNAIGYTFDYGLDNIPYNLRPIGKELKSFDDGGMVNIAPELKDLNPNVEYVLFKSENDLKKITNVLKEYDGFANEEDRLYRRNKLYNNVNGRLMLLFSNSSVDMILELSNKYGANVEKYRKTKYALGGLFGKAKQSLKPAKLPNLEGKQVSLKNGKMVQVFEQNGSQLSVLELGRIGTGERPHLINISEVDMTSFKNGGALIGNQKRIDMNKNGKIDAEDFKLLRSSMNGAWRNERKHVNHNEDYEVRYAKPRPKRTGYKGKRKFEGGGGLSTAERFKKVLAKNNKANEVKPKNQKSNVKTGATEKKGNRGGVMLLAKKIRKEGESWKDALKRAGQQLK